MIKITMISIFLMSMSPCLINAYDMSEESLRGTRNFWQVQDYEMASKFFHRVLQNNYANHEKSYAYLYLGKIALKQNDVNKAIFFLNKSNRLYSTPYPVRILYNFFCEQKDKKHAKYYFDQMIDWYENRLVLLLSNQFDVSQIFFQNTRSCIDGSSDAFILDVIKICVFIFPCYITSSTKPKAKEVLCLKLRMRKPAPPLFRMKYGEILKPDMNTVCMLFF